MMAIEKERAIEKEVTLAKAISLINSFIQYFNKNMEEEWDVWV